MGGTLGSRSAHKPSPADDEVLKTQLSSQEYEFDNKGRYKVDPRKKTKPEGLCPRQGRGCPVLAVSMKGPLQA